MGIKITSELNYKVEIDGSIYYPAMLDMVEFDNEGKPSLSKEGHVGIYYFVLENETLNSRVRSIDLIHLKHINFLNPEKEIPKVFLRRDLAEILGECGFSHVYSNLIKNISEIPDYKKYFEIFKGKEPKDLFSRFAGTSVFPKI